ncbi:MAG TPA: MFS transporter [Kineosporiaceae bacterium]|nr:MFS transporter [Kineosporiaceae bacterium]
MSTEATSPSPVVQTGAEPTRPVGARWTALLALANLGLWIGYFGPLQVSLPNQMQAIDPAGKETALAIATGIGAAIALVVNPLTGALSDRTTSRFGRRHPWSIVGALIGAGGLAFLAGQTSLTGVIIGWCLAQTGLNMLQAAITAAVPDHVPVHERATVSGWITSQQLLGLVAGVVLVGIVVTGLASGYLALAIAVPILALPFVLGTRDPVLDPKDRPVWSTSEFLSGFWISPRAHPDFAWAWLTRFLMQLSYSMATLYLLYYLRDELHYETLFPGSDAETGLLILILINTVVAMIATVIGGVISDRSGRRKRSVTIAGLILSAPGVALALWPSWPCAVGSAVVLGLGYGVYMSVDQALVTQVLPAAVSRGRDLGLINIANSAPQVLAPAIAAPLIAHAGGYPALYFSVAGVSLLGAVLVRKIQGVP